MKNMTFSIKELKQKTVNEPFYFQETVDVSDLAALDNNDIREITSVVIDGFATVEKDEFIFSFTIKGDMILPCARTLADVSYPFSIQATELFSTVPQLERDGDEEEVHQITEETLDLTPYIKENIILEMPYRVFSDEKAIETGVGWELFDEDAFEQHEQERMDPRLSKLQQLLDQKENNTEE